MLGLVGSNLRRQIDFQHGPLILIACARELFQVKHSWLATVKRRNGFIQSIELWEVLVHEEICSFIKRCDWNDCILFNAANEKYS